MKKYKLKLFKDFISSVVVVIVVIFTFISILINVQVFGYKSYNILTGSMSPTINSGSLIVVKNVDGSEIKEGDIITFRGSSTSNLTTHRVVEIKRDNEKIKFQTKGDANKVLDPMLVSEELLVGKVIFNIPYLGKVMNLINEYRVYIIVSIIVYLCFSIFFKNTKLYKNKN